VDANPGLHADRGHGVAEHVVELTGDAQPFLDRAAASLLLAGLGLAGKLSAGGHQQCPVVADRRAGGASGGGHPYHDAREPGRHGSAEGHADRRQRAQRGHHRTGQPSPPSPQARQGVAGAFFGSGFTDKLTDGYSLGMAIAFAVALACYAVGLYATSTWRSGPS
jgi:hypothetical protein